MKKASILLFLTLAISSCKNTKLEVEIPSDVIPVDTIVRIMSDISVMEKVVQKDYPHLVRNTEIIKNSGDSILKNYQINYSRYKRSLEYYTSNMDTMVYIYDRMSDRISIQLNELNN